MVAPDPAAQGGIASVAAILLEAGLCSDGNVLLLPSFRDGSVLTKLRAASSAWLSYVFILLRGGGSVLHVQAASQASFWRKAVFIWTATIARRRVVFQLHAGGFREFFESLSRPSQWLLLATLRRVDLLLCLSSEAENWLRKLLPDVAIRWWPNPIPRNLFAIAGCKKERDPVLLYLGALIPAKGLNDLLVAFTELHAANPKARLILAGAGPELRKLSDSACKLGVGDAVSFPGWVGASEKRECFTRAWALVLPSYVEAQPMVLLEAMAAGVAVVSTRVGGVPDLIADGEQGLLVAPGRPDQLAAALLRIWNDNALRTEMASRARRRVEERHKAENVCDSLMALYRELAQGSQ